MFEFAGGMPAFEALAAAHHKRCLEDPVLAHPSSHTGSPDHVRRLAEYWAEVFGGPPTYSESFGGHSAMLGIHAGEGADKDLGAPAGSQVSPDLPVPRWGWNGLE
jgi:hemoglobin